MDSTTVIIGANGAGKSSLINELRKNSIDEMYVLPAQKLLYFVSNIHDRNGISRERYIQDLKKSILNMKQLICIKQRLKTIFQISLLN